MSSEGSDKPADPCSLVIAFPAHQLNQFDKVRAQMKAMAKLRSLVPLKIAALKGTYQGFSLFIANSFYMSDLMYLLRTQIIFHNVQ